MWQAWMEGSDDGEYALLLKGKNAFDPSEASWEHGGMRAKTIASLMDSFFGDAKTGVQSVDYRAVPGWRSGGTHFITVRLPEETRASMLGSKPFLAKTGVNFTLFRGGLAQKRVYVSRLMQGTELI